MPHLVISVSKNSTEISIKHDDVHVLCEKEEIALLGKLFSIINGRIRFENYQERVYQPFIGTIEIGEHASLLKNILKVINPPNIE